MYKAADGKQFAHEGMGKSYDGALAGGKGGLKPSGGKSDHDADDAQSVVAQHGPAHTTQIAKQKDGSHSVHSHHEDGHKHVSHGHNIESAHKHSMEMHGNAGGNPDEHEQGDSEGNLSENTSNDAASGMASLEA
jgi:hypothetical protein